MAPPHWPRATAHDWFAWFPVRLNDWRWTWLRPVRRVRVWPPFWLCHLGGSFWEYEGFGG